MRRLTPAELADPVHPYIRIRDDGTIVAYSSQIEMGQGIHTGLATIVAEELDADFDSVRVVNAANGGGADRRRVRQPDVGGALQITGASNSTEGFWVRYRLVAAQARARLVAAAAEAWGVPARGGRDRARASCATPAAREATFAELAARAEQLPGARRRAAEGAVRLPAASAAKGGCASTPAEDPRRHPIHDRRTRCPGC